jgi:hypothetical protein
MLAIRHWTISTIAAIILAVAPAQAAERAQISEFLKVTGFDVALESIKLSAGSAPEMIGFDTSEFGSRWTSMSEDIFDVNLMHDLALDILEKALNREMLTHAATFYETEFGQRLVAAENAAHMNPDEAVKREMGDAILRGLRDIDSPRVRYLERINVASDSANIGVRAIQEIQVRFLLAASSSGVINLQIEDPTELREALQGDEVYLRQAIEESALSGAAYTYQAFGDLEVLEYVKALEHPAMQEVYNLMNAVQYEIMANRFEALAIAMAELQPSEEL